MALIRKACRKTYLSSIAFPILPLEELSEKWQFVGVARQLAWKGMTEIGEQRTGVCNPAAHCSKKIAAAEAILTHLDCSRTRHRGPL